jgi:hypothetical protein
MVGPQYWHSEPEEISEPKRTYGMAKLEASTGNIDADFCFAIGVGYPRRGGICPLRAQGGPHEADPSLPSIAGHGHRIAQEFSQISPRFPGNDLLSA